MMRWVSPTLVLAAGLTLTASVVALVGAYEAQLRREGLDHITEARYRSLEEQLAIYRQGVAALQGHFSVTRGHASRDEFRTLVAPLLQNMPGTQALEWAPRVTPAERGRFETRLARWQAGAVVREVGPDGLRPAAPRSHYYPVALVEPIVGNEAAVGFDLASHPDRRWALDVAATRGSVVATAPIDLVQETGTQKGFLLVAPVLATAPRTALTPEGFVLGVFRAGDILEHALSQLVPQAVSTELLDVTGGDELLLASHLPDDGPMRADTPPAHSRTRVLSFAGRTLRLRVSALGPVSLMPGATLGVTAIAGLLVSFIGAWAVARVLAAKDNIERLVAERAHQLSDALNQAERAEHQAVQAQKMEVIARLTGGVAHDFNNLLTAIGMHADAVGRGEAPESFVKEVRRAVAAGKALSTQILGFARPSEGKAEVTDLNEHVARLSQTLMPLVGENTTIELRLSDAPAWVLAAPAEISQVVLNLLLNAADAMPEGGRVTLQTERRRSYVCPDTGAAHGPWHIALTVSDEGPGVEAGVAKLIFEPFFTTKGGGRGTGLGLSTVRRIVDGLGGMAELVDPEDGIGATFRVLLPECEPATPAATVDDSADAPSPPRSTPRRRHRVLVVDDNQMVRLGLVSALQAGGFEASAAQSGEEALEMATAAPPSLVLSDLSMPGMDGFTLSRKLHDAKPDLPIVLMTGFHDDGNEAEAEAAGALALLSKPFDSEELIAVATKACGGGARHSL